MKRLSLLAFVLVLSMGTVAKLRNGIRQEAFFRAANGAGETTNGAFRDGLYLGRLAAERGSGFHVASGRWATDQDRASFSAGYKQGYNRAF